MSLSVHPVRTFFVKSNILVRMLIRTFSVQSDILIRLLLLITYQGYAKCNTMHPPICISSASVFRLVNDGISASCLDPARSFGLILDLIGLDVLIDDMHVSIGVSADSLPLIQFYHIFYSISSCFSR